MNARRYIRYEILAVESGPPRAEWKLLPSAYSTMKDARTHAQALANTGEYRDIKIVETITVRTTHDFL